MAAASLLLDWRSGTGLGLVLVSCSAGWGLDFTVSSSLLPSLESEIGMASEVTALLTARTGWT